MYSSYQLHSPCIWNGPCYRAPSFSYERLHAHRCGPYYVDGTHRWEQDKEQTPIENFFIFLNQSILTWPTTQKLPLQARIAELTALVAQNNVANNANDPNRPLREYTAPRTDEIHLGYMEPDIRAKEYQINPAWIASIQHSLFHGHAVEDAVQHLANFEDLCLTQKVRTISNEDLKRMMFTFTLAGKAKNWIRSQRPDNMDTWTKMSNALLNQFFPPDKTDGIRHQIHNFRQEYDETLANAWERFNELTRSCPHHGIPEWSLLRIFYGGLSNNDRLILDATAGGSLCELRIDEEFKLINSMALNQTQFHKPREDLAYLNAKMNKVEGKDKVLEEIYALKKQIADLAVNSNPSSFNSQNKC